MIGIALLATLPVLTVASKPLGCIRNASFVGISSSVTAWLYNITNCHQCTCFTLQNNAVAYNCHALETASFNCEMFQSYYSASNYMGVAPTTNGSSACFFETPPSSINQLPSEFRMNLTVFCCQLRLRRSDVKNSHAFLLDDSSREGMHDDFLFRSSNGTRIYYLFSFEINHDSDQYSKAYVLFSNSG